MMKDRYLFPKNIAYNTDDLSCLVSCPRGETHFAGSLACQLCRFHIGMSKTHVLCVRKPKKGGKG